MVRGREVRSLVLEPRRSPAVRELPDEEPWTWEAAKSLGLGERVAVVSGRVLV
jgi:hypothetical protein